MRSKKSCSQSGLWPGWVLRTSSVSLSRNLLVVINSGADYLITVTNAAGSLNPSIPVGTSMLLSQCSQTDLIQSCPVVVLHDHLGIPNLSGFNPLLGPQHDPKIPRFLPTSNAYSTSLRRLFFYAVHDLGLNLDDFAEGTYAWVSGPTFESPAEGRFLRAAGADVVGMSTVPEVLAAKEEGLEVIALSLVTNFVVIPDSYRSIKDEVKAEVFPCSLCSLTWEDLFTMLRVPFSSKGRSSRTLLSQLSLTRRFSKSA